MAIQKNFDYLARNGASDLYLMVPRMRAMARMLCRDREEADALALDALASFIGPGGGQGGDGRLVLGNPRVWSLARVGEHFRRLKWRSFRLSRGRDGATPHEPDALRGALGELTDEQREALVLVVAAGLTYEEAASAQGCAVGAMERRVSAACRTLLAFLTPDPAWDEDKTKGPTFADEPAPLRARA